MHRWRFLATQRGEHEWLIDGDEAQHASRVLRLAAGDAVEVCDGAGLWAFGHLRTATGKSLVVDAERAQRESPPPWRLSVAVGALKPGAIDDVLPGLVELGVDRLMVYQQHGVAKARLAAPATQRWQRIILSAMKQSKRATLPELSVYASLQELVVAQAGVRVALVPGAPQPLFALLEPLSEDLLLLLGGEKGLDASELALLQQNGFQAASLGPTVLRAVTATVAATAVAALRRAASTC